jgi:hypothetical protein
LSEPLSDRYWLEEFRVTRADQERIEGYIRQTEQAHDLTTLARRVVRGRLHYGPETSAPAQPRWVESLSVRLWDPAGKWKAGDHVIVARREKEGLEAFVGEIVGVEASRVKLQLDGIDQPVTYLRAAPGSYEASIWHATVRKVVEEKLHAPELEERAEAVLLTHGERVASQLLDALRADGRFVHLAGRWFLRDLAAPPTEEQLTALAWAMVSLEEPQPTEALVPLVRPPLAEGDRGLFGLYLAMREHPHLFRNVDPRQRPRWVLAGPPPGSCVPRYAAYDPETYDVLCLPGQPILPETVQRLWDLGLLRAVL